jgi:hypothetical protein
MLVPYDSTRRTTLHKHYRMCYQVHQCVVAVYTASEHAFENTVKTVELTLQAHLTR